MHKRIQNLARGSCVFICLLFLVQILGCGRKTAVYLESGETSSEESEEQESTEETADAGELWVYVCGAVVCPGVYVLEPGSRVCDAIHAAGGLAADACEISWNQAEPVYDGEMIEVPTLEEAEQRASGSGAEAETPAETDGRININTASKEELMGIPGIGEAKAEAILRYREEHGNFDRAEDIMNVSGIKEGSFEKMKDYIRAD